MVGALRIGRLLVVLVVVLVIVFVIILVIVFVIILVVVMMVVMVIVVMLVMMIIMILVVRLARRRAADAHGAGLHPAPRDVLPVAVADLPARSLVVEAGALGDPGARDPDVLPPLPPP